MRKAANPFSMSVLLVSARSRTSDNVPRMAYLVVTEKLFFCQATLCNVEYGASITIILLRCELAAAGTGGGGTAAAHTTENYLRDLESTLPFTLLCPKCVAAAVAVLFLLHGTQIYRQHPPPKKGDENELKNTPTQNNTEQNAEQSVHPGVATKTRLTSPSSCWLFPSSPLFPCRRYRPPCYLSCWRTDRCFAAQSSCSRRSSRSGSRQSELPPRPRVVVFIVIGVGFVSRFPAGTACEAAPVCEECLSVALARRRQRRQQKKS